MGIARLTAGGERAAAGGGLSGTGIPQMACVPAGRRAVVALGPWLWQVSCTAGALMPAD